ncbi:muconolactone Delta-isomerase family protein [Halocola ammonii]
MYYMIEFKVPPITKSLSRMIPIQQMKVDELMTSGRMISYALSTDRKKLWAVVDAETEFEAMDIIAELPMTVYMKADVQPLMFHNSAQHVMPTFSAN